MVDKGPSSDVNPTITSWSVYTNKHRSSEDSQDKHSYYQASTSSSYTRIMPIAIIVLRPIRPQLRWRHDGELSQSRRYNLPW